MHDNCCVLSIVPKVVGLFGMRFNDLQLILADCAKLASLSPASTVCIMIASVEFLVNVVILFGMDVMDIEYVHEDIIAWFSSFVARCVACHVSAVWLVLLCVKYREAQSVNCGLSRSKCELSDAKNGSSTVLGFNINL